MTFNLLLKQKWVLCAALVVAIPLLLHLLGNPFLQFAPDKVDTTRVNCLSDFDTLVLDDAEIEGILTICSSLKAAWLPTPQFHGPPILPKEQQQFIGLMFVGYTGLNIFVLEDGDIYAELAPWENDLVFQIKNPEHLREVVELVNRHVQKQQP